MAQRLALATFLASVAVILSFAGILILVASATAPIDQRGSHSIADALHGIFFFFFFGWPLSLAVTAAVGIPAFHFLNDRAMLTFDRSVTLGAATGAVTIPGVWALFWGQLDLNPILWVLLGAAVGFIASTVFWAVARGAAVTGKRPWVT